MKGKSHFITCNNSSLYESLLNSSYSGFKVAAKEDFESKFHDTFESAFKSLEDNNIFQFISSHRMLCYENDIGKLALLRQLNPDLHIEHDEEFIEVSTKFFKKIIHSTFLDNISLNKNVRHQ